MLVGRAWSPLTAVELRARYSRIHGLEHLGELWETWEVWFVELEETHTSLAPLNFFRSPRPDRSWITAAGAGLCASPRRRPNRRHPDDGPGRPPHSCRRPPP